MRVCFLGNGPAQALARSVMLAISIGGPRRPSLEGGGVIKSHGYAQDAAIVAVRLLIFHVSSLKEDYHVWKVHLHSLDSTDAVDGR